MRNTNLNIPAFVLFAMLILAGYQAEAQREGGNESRRGYRSENPRGSDDGYGRFNRLESALDLSDEQKTQIEKLHLDMQKELLPTFNEIREKNAQLSTMVSENESESKINQLIYEIGNLEVIVRKRHINTHFKVRELLTDEQKVKFDTFSGKRRNGMRGHPGGMGRYGLGRI